MHTSPNFNYIIDFFYCLVRQSYMIWRLDSFFIVRWDFFTLKAMKVSIVLEPT